MKTHRFLMVTALALILTSNAGAFPKITELIHYYGAVNSAALDGNYAYVGTNYGLATLDISNIEHPELVNFQDVNSIREVFIAGGNLYAKRNGLTVYSLSDPSHPSRPENIPINYYPAYQKIHDGVLGVSTMYTITDFRNEMWWYYGGFYFYNAQNPSETEWVFHSDWTFDDFDWNGNYVYVCANQGHPLGDDVQIWDITPEQDAEMVASMNNLLASSLLIHENRLIVLAHTLQSFSLDDPINPSDPITFPEFLDSTSIYGQLSSVGDMLYVRKNGVWLYDLSNPLEPVFITHYEPPDYFRQVAIDGDRIAATSQNAIHFLDASDPSEIVDIAQVEFPAGKAKKVQSCGNHLTLITEDDGVYTYSVDDPISPEREYHFTGENEILDAIQQGSFLYQCVQGEGLAVIDVSNPHQPARTELFEGGFKSVSIWDNLLYAIDSESGLNVFQLDDPVHPQLLRQIRELRSAESIRLDYPRLYGYYSNGFALADISDLDSVSIYRSPLPSHEGYEASNLDFEAIGNYGFQLVGFSYDYRQADYDWICLYVYDVSNMREFVAIDSIQLRSSTYYNLYNIGDYLGFTSGSHSYVIDPEEVIRNHEIVSVSNFGTDAPPVSTTQVGSSLFTASGQAFTAYDMSDFVGAPDIAPIPENLTLLSSYPNPFNPSTTLTYTLPVAEQVKLSIYDLAGRQVAALFDGYQSAGEHNISWNAEKQPTGFYIVRLSTPLGNRDVKLLLMK